MSQSVPAGASTNLQFCCTEYAGGAVLVTDIESANLLVPGLYLVTLVLPFNSEATVSDPVTGLTVVSVSVDDLTFGPQEVATWKWEHDEVGPLARTATPATTFSASVGSKVYVKCLHDVQASAVDTTLTFHDECTRTVTLLAQGPKGAPAC